MPPKRPGRMWQAKRLKMGLASRVRSIGLLHNLHCEPPLRTYALRQELSLVRRRCSA